MCINQTDELEKRHTVNSMDLVYKSARLVVVLLEDVWLSEDDMKIADWLVTGDPYDADRFEAMKELPHFAVGFLELYKKVFFARYFNRAWCLQETVIASESTFLLPCESGVVQWSLNVFKDLRCTNLLLNHERWDEYKGYSSLGFLKFAALGRDNRSLKSPFRVHPYADRFDNILDLSVSRPSDIVSIALNVTSLPLAYLGQASSKLECHWLLAIIALCAGDSSTLSANGIPLLVGPNSTPSWLSQLDGHADTLSLGAPRILADSGIWLLEPSFIQLDLLQVPTLTNTFHPDPKFLRIARTMAKRYLADHQPLFLMQPVPGGTPVFQRALNLITATLACSISLGSLWVAFQGRCIRKNSDQMLKQNAREIYQRHNTKMYDAIALDLGWTHVTQSEMSEILWYIWYIAVGNPFQEELYENGSLRKLIDSLPEQAVALWRYGDRPQSAAITNPLDVKHNEGNIYAIPKALCTSNCAVLKRLWILSPVTGEHGKGWVIKDKQVFFTQEELVPDGSNLLHLPDQKVYGDLEWYNRYLD